MVNPEHGISRVVHHKDYYLRGGDMTVLVENHLYRIHSYFFDRESFFFRQKFNGSNDNDLGSTDNNAYTLDDVKSEDFARFLWVFYNPKYSLYEAPLETWLSILKLANRWNFDNVKELSVRELEKLTIEPVEKVAIYHDHNISRLYLIPSYVDICKRDKPLSFTEGMKLGMETVLRIADARERVRQHASESGVRTPTFDDFEDAEVEVLIREVFGLGSRPTSPSPATAPTNGVNGSHHAVAVQPFMKLGNPPKPNGASARLNGGSAADTTTKSSVDSIMGILQPQGPTPRPQTPAPPAPAPPAQAQAQTPTPLLEPTQASAPPPPPATDKPKDKVASPQEADSGLGPKSAKPTGGEPASSASGTFILF
ncbi:hypothetical protein BDN67DRAFT_900865 [Paxillus ammoniavirescens]|nr:hypothetical protein BDN67DRAFT_900865 [Paxillus ammoniavirescens]